MYNTPCATVRMHMSAFVSVLKDRVGVVDVG